MRVTGIAALIFVSYLGLLSAQGAQAPTEASELAQGWSLLAQGDAAKASALAGDLLKRYPRSGAVLMFAVETALVQRGANAGLDAYERWLGSKKVEAAYALRRVSQTILREAARNEKNALTGSQALDALLADGDPDLSLRSDTSGVSANVVNAGRPAELGNESAFDSLIGALKTPMANKPQVIAGLARSRNPRAIKPLIEVLSDPDPLTRAAAADALGKLGSAAAIPQLKQLLDDPVFNVHLSAAAALLALKDTSGLPWLQEMQKSEHAGIRLATAQASKSDVDSTWLEVVRGLTKDADPEIRRQAAVLIAPHDADTARETLEPLLQDANPAQREAASASYMRSVVSDFAALRGFLKETDPALRVQAAARILELTR